jgi:hypothetical protein
MSDELQFLWWHMRGDFGWLMAVISWITAARLVFKPINGMFQSYIASRPAAQTEWAKWLLSSPLWGFLSFLLDYLASVKLPRVSSGDTVHIRKEEVGK